MVSVEYSEAATEVLDILNNTNQEDIEKIPKQFIEFLKQYSSKSYKPVIDYSKPIEEMNLKKKTIDILSIICNKYWCDDLDKIEFINMLEWNEIMQENKLSEKYDTSDIFKNKTNDNIVGELIVVETNNNFFTKIINIIKNKLKIQ